MAFREEHELHRRRFGRNLGLGLVLASFVGVVFALTVVKVRLEPPAQGADRFAPVGQATQGAAP